MDPIDAARGDEDLRPAVEAYARLSASLVGDADAAPGDCVAERFARGLLCGEEAGEPFGDVALAQRVGDLFIGIDLPAEPRERAVVEAVARHLCEVQADAEDHAPPFVEVAGFSG